jgi:hypothetical protein
LPSFNFTLLNPAFLPSKLAQSSFSSLLHTTMANTKSVTELPRFLLPKLSWTTPTVKGAASQIRSTRTSHPRPRIPTFQQPLPVRTAQAPLSPNRSYSQSNWSEPSQKRLPASSQTHSAADAAPIRYNGVYATAFKPARRAFSSSRALKKDHHFDTLKFVQRLRGEGFSEEQAVAMMRVLNDVIEESIQNLTRTMVLKEGE